MATIDFNKHYLAPTALFKGKAATAHINDVSIVMSNVSNWADDEVKQLLEELAKTGGGVTPPANIVIFLGDVFDAKQRRFATEWTQTQGFPPAKRITMISDSMLIRGAMTAYSWVTKSEAKAFAMKDSTAMCQWITQGLIAEPEKVKANLAACFKLLGKTLP
jgi:hypothetical protein